MRKKSQIGQVFIYLISTLIIMLVLYFGYNAIKNIGKKQQEISFVTFKNRLTDMITYTSSDYGTVRVENFDVPAGFTEVCIVDPSLIVTKDSSKISDNYPIIKDSVADGAMANVFLLPAGSPFYIEKVFIETDSKYICFPVVQGKVKIRIEGMGDRAKLSSP